MHIMDNHGRLSPSAFIPFCEFGGNMAIMGEINPLVEAPVCNKFRPKFRNGQLCYQVNVNEVKDQIDNKDDQLIGLTFLLDYNDERMIQVKNSKSMDESPDGLYKMQNENKETKREVKIFIETIGKLQ